MLPVSVRVYRHFYYFKLILFFVFLICIEEHGFPLVIEVLFLCVLRSRLCIWIVVCAFQASGCFVFGDRLRFSY